MALIKSSHIISATRDDYFITKACIKNIITLYSKSFHNNRYFLMTKCRKMVLIFYEHLCTASCKKIDWHPTMAVRYGTFTICELRNPHLERYRTSVPYLNSTFEAYRTRAITKKAYRTSIPYFLAKIEAYRTALPSLL